MINMKLRKYAIEQPSSEEELGKELRARALGRGVLELIALIEEDDSSLRHTLSMKIDSIHLQQEGDELPFIIGQVSETIGEEQFFMGTGRLEVTGSSSQPESERALRLHVTEDTEKDD